MGDFARDPDRIFEARRGTRGQTSRNVRNDPVAIAAAKKRTAAFLAPCAGSLGVREDLVLTRVRPIRAFQFAEYDR